MNETKRNSVLIVDDDRSNIITLTHIIVSLDYTVHVAKNGRDAVETAMKCRPDVIILDIIMPDMDGYEVLALLKGEEQTRAIPVVFISGLGKTEDEEKGLLLGASDYISKPFSPTVVKLRIQNQIQIINQMDMIRNLSMIDSLTGIPNRRNFDYRLTLEWNHAIRNKTPLSILLIDLDRFKVYNDTYGHLQGDIALKTTAEVITGSFKRSIDFAARWGGEEFAVLLPNTDSESAHEIAELIRENIEFACVPCTDCAAAKITTSIGLNTVIPTLNHSVDNFIKEADEALYSAKKTGKNKVCKYNQHQ
ncbi:MAG: diguanylate cyclase [Chitinispirillia bacterium]|nr:diguanylate cyclase [Chitinispirillia bacterium]